MDPNSLTPVRYRVTISQTPVYERDHVYIKMCKDVGAIANEKPEDGDTPYFNTPETTVWFKLEEITYE